MGNTSRPFCTSMLMRRPWPGGPHRQRMTTLPPPWNRTILGLSSPLPSPHQATPSPLSPPTANNPPSCSLPPPTGSQVQAQPHPQESSPSPPPSLLGLPSLQPLHLEDPPDPGHLPATLDHLPTPQPSSPPPPTKPPPVFSPKGSGLPPSPPLSPPKHLMSYAAPAPCQAPAAVAWCPPCTGSWAVSS